MISSAEEFIGLVESSVAIGNSRGVIEQANHEVWPDVANKYPGYEGCIIQGSTISFWLIGFLSRSKNCNTRHSVAMKREAEESVFIKLSGDDHPIVRQAVAASREHSGYPA